MKRLAIITSHPIQYNAPWFKLLAERKKLAIMIFYTWGQLEQDAKYDPGFGENVAWDIPLLEGYDFTFVKNTATKPGTHHFKGIVNPTLNKEIEEWTPDAILVFGWSFYSHLKCLRFFHQKIPVLFRGDSTLLDEDIGIKKILRRLFLKWVYSHVDIAMYVGLNNKEYFLSHGLKPGQLLYAPHAIDNNRFAQPDDIYQAGADILKKNAGIQKEDLVLLFAGKLEKKKNPLFLIRLLKLVDDKRVKIIFVGTGELMETMQSAAAADDRILLMGFKNQQQMPVMYRVADLFVLPSAGPGETWGLALNEAMASGKAVIATNKTGGAINLIDEGINGLIIDLKNNDKILQLIEQSFIDKEIVFEMGRQSRLKIESFTFNHIVNAIEDIMTNAINSKSYKQELVVQIKNN